MKKYDDVYNVGKNHRKLTNIIDLTNYSII